MEHKDLKRAWIISDLHFGVHSSAVEWIDTARDYYNNFFFPLLDREAKKGDCCLILGDVFENRQSINILAMNEAMKTIKGIASRMPVFMIVGNHDCYKKFSTDTNSSIMFKDLDNVKVIEKEEAIKFAYDRTGLFIAWIENKEEMKEKLKSSGHYDYLFLHEDFSGMKNSTKSVVPGGLPYALVNNFEFVYSGHIHFGQKVKNVTMVGNPFHTTVSDTDNDKYVYLIDFKDKSEKRFLNDYSPRYMKLELEEAKKLGDKELKKLCNNNYVEFIVDTTKIKTFDYEGFADNLNEAKTIQFKPVSTETEEEEEIIVSSNMTNEGLIDEYVDKLSYDDRIKNKIKEVAKKILKKAQEG